MSLGLTYFALTHQKSVLKAWIQKSGWIVITRVVIVRNHLSVGEPRFGMHWSARPERYYGLTENQRETAPALCVSSGGTYQNATPILLPIPNHKAGNAVVMPIMLVMDTRPLAAVIAYHQVIHLIINPYSIKKNLNMTTQINTLIRTYSSE